MDWLAFGLRAQLLRGAAVSWLLTFGRHLFDVRRGAVALQPRRRPGEENYEIFLSDEEMAAEKAFSWIQSLARFSFLRFFAHTGGWLEEFRRVSMVHRGILEGGVGWMPQGIPMRFKPGGEV